MMKAWVLLVVIATTGALSLVASTETDWSGKSGAVTIPAGETWVADEADMAQVNALAKITLAGAVAETEGVEPQAAGTLIFRNTTTVPKEGLLAGAGAVRKSGSSDWTVANAQSDFTGDFHLEGGVITVNAPATFGKYLEQVEGGVYVWDGASLVLNSGTVDFRWRKVHIAGTGTAGSPYALKVVSCKNGAVGYLQLEDDAAIHNGSSHYWMSNQGVTVYPPGGIINLQSYTLTKYGSSTPMSFLGLEMIGSGKLVLQEGNFYYREKSSLGDPDDELGPIVFPDVGESSAVNFNFYNKPRPVYRPLEIHRSVYLDYSFNDKASYRGLANTNQNLVVGNVSIADGRYVKIQPGLNDNTQITLAGTVSGAGKIIVGKSKTDNCAGIAALMGHNTYTGGTEVYGEGRLGLYAAYADSIPDYASTLVYRGYVAAMLGFYPDGVTPRWTKEDLWRFANTATFEENGHLSIDARECPEGVYELTAEEINANITDPARRGIGSAGGTLRIRNESNETPQRVKLTTDRGRVELVGGGTFTLDGDNELKGAIRMPEPYNRSNKAGLSESNPLEDKIPVAEVRVTDGVTVIQGDEYVSVGGRRRPTESDVYGAQGMARLVISNATWKTTSTASFSAVPAATDGMDGGEYALSVGSIYVGHRNRGILEVQDGALVSNRVVVGGGEKFSAGPGVGAIYLKGGELEIVRKGLGHLSSCIGSAGYGGLVQTGGRLVVRNTDLIIGGYNQGVAHVYGGEASIDGVLALSGMNGGKGILYITNSTWTVFKGPGTGESYIRCASGYPNQVDLTVDGPDAKLLTSSWLYMSSSTGNTIRVNLNNEGVLRLQGFHFYKSLAEEQARGNLYPGVLNWNGGVLMASGTWASGDLLSRSDVNRMARVAVYEKGAIIDTSVAPNDDTIYVQRADLPFEAAGAGGIQSVTLDEPLYGFVGAPWVHVDNMNGGTGVGASLVAEWDPVNECVTGVRVVSHGWGYEPDKVKLYLETDVNVRRLIFTNEDGKTRIAIADNETGGFTKRGKGTLELRAVNGWQKWTAIEGGVIKPTVAGAIPSGTELRLNGGTLDLNNLASDAPTFTGLVGTGGTVKNGAVKIVGNWQISAQKFLDRETTALAGTLDLTACTGITITDGHLLDSDAARALKRLPLFTATTVIWPGKTLAITIDGVQEKTANWSAKKTDTSVSLGFSAGLVLIFR